MNQVNQMQNRLTTLLMLTTVIALTSLPAHAQSKVVVIRNAKVVTVSGETI